jgi:putative hydrolase of the HAD superfamily
MAPEQVVCVGDDIENDVKGALNAGMGALLLERGAPAGVDVPYVTNLTALLPLNSTNFEDRPVGLTMTRGEGS